MRLREVEEGIDVTIRTDDLPSFLEVMRSNVNPAHWDLVMEKMNLVRSEDALNAPLAKRKSVSSSLDLSIYVEDEEDPHQDKDDREVSKEKAVSQMISCLGSVRSFELLQSKHHKQFSANFDPVIYSYFIKAVQMDVHQKDLLHGMLKKLLEDLWSDQKVNFFLSLFPSILIAPPPNPQTTNQINRSRGHPR